MFVLEISAQRSAQSLSVCLFALSSFSSKTVEIATETELRFASNFVDSSVLTMPSALSKSALIPEHEIASILFTSSLSAQILARDSSTSPTAAESAVAEIYSILSV